MREWTGQGAHLMVTTVTILVRWFYRKMKNFLGTIVKKISKIQYFNEKSTKTGSETEIKIYSAPFKLDFV